jgi:chorismate mutase/prephenate dehydratase
MMGYDEEISALRLKIDGIDAKLTALFEQRMDAVAEVARVKSAYGKEVLDSAREREVLERAVSRLDNKGYSEQIKAFFRSIMDISKMSEARLMAPPPSSAPAKRVGYLGIPGSFSHTAAEEMYGHCELISYDTFGAIFEGLKKDEISIAMLPAENTETGSITAVVDLLAKYGFYIVAEKLLKVRQSLLGVKGTKPGEIKVVYSHPEPFAQCSAFLAARPGIETRPSLSTAQAASTVAQAGDTSVACIASSKAAQIYGLEVLAENIQNSDGNCTRFVAVAKQPCESEECDKTSIVFMVEHRPGSLCEILSILQKGGVNILKLESRPIKDKPFEYMFHLDFEGSIHDKGIAEAIDSLKKAAADYIYLGSYKREAVLP